jgi:signal transduction histidine kinase
MAHEINTPLACVMANLELLSRRMQAEGGTLTDGAEELIADAREGAERIRCVIRLVQRIAREVTPCEAE